MKQIEISLSLEQLNQLAVEKVTRIHPWNLHLWWNRSPIMASAKLLKAVLTDEDGILPQAMPTVCDPFAGSGSLVLAAELLGFSVQAGDLNGVAALITKAGGEIPSCFAGAQAVNPAATTLPYKGTEGLREDVQYYGKRLEAIVQKQLTSYYPPEAYAWVWIRTMPCPNPACGCSLPLGNSFILSELKEREYWAEPVYEDGELHFRIHQGTCPEEYKTNKHGSRGSRFQCPRCGTLTKDQDVKAAGQQGKMQVQLMAVVTKSENGRSYAAADATQLAAASVLVSDAPLSGAISHNTRWFSTPEYGLKNYADLYTPRQLKLLSTFCDTLPTVLAEIKKDAVQSGMLDDTVPLAKWGQGALAYSQAIGVYLALTISKLANFQSTLCTWDHRTGNVRAAFNRQALPMTWVFAEGNPFGKATGNYDSVLRQVAEALCQVPQGHPAVVTVGDARQFPYPQDAILFTELPYYDHVGYSDLSDYFYLWLRRCLGKIYPELFSSILSLKNELSSVVMPFTGEPASIKEQYEKDVAQLFTDFYPAAAMELPSVVFFRYGHEDEAIITGNKEPEGLSPLENLLNGIIQAGFTVTAIWPVPTEKIKKADSKRIAVVFRKQKSRFPWTTRRGFIQTVKRELGELLTKGCQNVEKEDQFLVGLGFGLQVLGSFSSVVNADGTIMRIHDALQIIAQEVVVYQEKEAETSLIGER
ncbi:DUF1156 domain-containing protein [Megasphaera stantonii]|uniref:DUF1156 domain-containing protein n=1 Tax=Megasphaera stantonii TaxID=2144175 RepID=UPI00195B5973|nr:DUF1156 domain-containing protein [Megasphaera stantonii]MBM6732434.1 DUF1156 domain-containing protein [Megasphaera stantonii]